MKNKTNVIFILGSGRCGTYSFYKALSRVKNIEAYHEFFFEPTLRIANLYHMKRISKKEIIHFLKKNHLYSITNSTKKIWVDSSNALPWIADVLVELFPDAKFVHLIRNGKKVVSSFYNKHRDIMYNKRDILKLIKFLNKKNKYISSEKKYWRPIPIDDYQKLKEFLNKSQFSKICNYWSEINLKIYHSIQKAKNRKTFMFEDIKKKKKLFELIRFMGIRKYDFDIIKKSFQKPVNVTIPKNIYLKNSQIKCFQKECGNSMKKFNYNNDNEYKVIY
mgnify:FL=1